MDVDMIVEYVKSRIGLRHTQRDALLKMVISGVVNELSEMQGLKLNGDSPAHLAFVVDLSTWRYENRDEPGDIPINLRYRLNNLILQNAGDVNGK